MNYFSKVSEIYREGRGVLETLLKEGQEVQLLENMEDENGYTDEFYELPQLTYVNKHNFALHYYLHTVFKKDGKVWVRGTEIEELETEEMQLDSVDYGTACFVIDETLDVLK